MGPPALPRRIATVPFQRPLGLDAVECRQRGFDPGQLLSSSSDSRSARPGPGRRRRAGRCGRGCGGRGRRRGRCRTCPVELPLSSRANHHSAVDRAGSGASYRGSGSQPGGLGGQIEGSARCCLRRQLGFVCAMNVRASSLVGRNDRLHLRTGGAWGQLLETPVGGRRGRPGAASRVCRGGDPGPSKRDRSSPSARHARRRPAPGCFHDPPPGRTPGHQHATYDGDESNGDQQSQ